MTPGLSVRLPFGWSGLGQAGRALRVPRRTSASLDVNAQNYSDTAPVEADDATPSISASRTTPTAARWHKLVGGADDLENLYPGIGNFTDSDARAVGILIVMNDLRSDVEAYIRNVGLTAASCRSPRPRTRC